MIRILMVALLAALLGACSVTGKGPVRDPAGPGNSNGDVGASE